ncbi:MAG: hypothetical protein L0Y72_21560 [Gemmataceae bacterium]|nr:hypothetical protein [Gemmataceae bacterium]MCI0741630.1 hypothetical protein [Gemmataceae bacterium]
MHDSGGQLPVNGFVTMQRRSNLPEVVGAIGTQAGVADSHDGGRRQSEKYPKNRNYDQQFDEAESLSPIPLQLDHYYCSPPPGFGLHT